MGPFGISIYTRRNKKNVKNGTLDRFRALYEKIVWKMYFLKKERETKKFIRKKEILIKLQIRRWKSINGR